MRGAAQLTVHEMPRDEVFRDRVRFDSSYRPEIGAGSICLLRAGWRATLVEVRQPIYGEMGIIFADMDTRRRLRIAPGSSYDFKYCKVGTVGEFIWLWRAADPISRTTGKLGVLALALGILSFLLAIPPFVDWLEQHNFVGKASQARHEDTQSSSRLHATDKNGRK